MRHEYSGDGDDVSTGTGSTSDEQMLRQALGLHSADEFITAQAADAMLTEEALGTLFDHDWTMSDAATDEGSTLDPSPPETHQEGAGTGMDVTVDLTPQPEKRHLTGRCPTILYLSCDPERLSEYQCLVRKQVEFFEATFTDIQAGAQGRNKPIVLGQVGIRCRHCAYVPLSSRGRSAVFYPSKLLNVYQASQNIATYHLQDSCTKIPLALRQELCALNDAKTRAQGGKEHWAKVAAALGVYDDDGDGLRFVARIHL